MELSNLKDNFLSGEYPVMGSNGISGYHNEYLVEAPTIIVGRKGSAGKVVYVEKNCFPIDTTFYVKLILPCVFKYVYYVLLNLELEKMIKGIGVPGINRNDIYQIQIPVPPLPVQEKLVSEVEKLEQEITKNQKIVDESPNLKQQVMKRYL
jgi:restriction endonuclease S subunit